MATTPRKARQEVEDLLGCSIAKAVFDEPRLTASQKRDDWQLDTLAFSGADGEPIPALFLHPADPEIQVPAVLYCHAHGNTWDFGMAELIQGRGSLQGPYGPALQRLGVASLCLEMPAFGARQEPTESARAKKHLWNGTTLFGQMLHELACGIGWLHQNPQITGERIAALGFSMGSTHAWWLAALDDRLKAAVALCSFADLATLTQTPASGGLGHIRHGIYMTVPGLLKNHTTGQIAGLAAPRALMLGIGLQDWSTPQNCFEKARADLELAYATAPNQLHFHVEPDLGHAESPAMRNASLAFLETQLCH
jgi:dienelactone hydrolase